MKVKLCTKKYIWSSKQFIFVFLLLLCGLISCSSKSKNAKYYLTMAQEYYKANNYENAKSYIDSIKLLHPKSFKEIKEGFALLQDVRRAENKRNIAFLDSVIEVNYTVLKEIQTKFDFVRDENYQEFGNYVPKLTPSSKPLEENTLRSRVSEKGVLFLESVISGSDINHNKIKVSIPDGSYAETLTVTSDGLNYKFTTLKRTYEIVRFIGKDENGVSEFIYTFKDSPITLTYLGKRNYTKTLSNTEKNAISQSFQLSSVLSEIENIKFEKGKTEALLRYLDKDKTNNDDV